MFMCGKNMPTSRIINQFEREIRVSCFSQSQAHVSLGGRVLFTEEKSGSSLSELILATRVFKGVLQAMWPGQTTAGRMWMDGTKPVYTWTG